MDIGQIQLEKARIYAYWSYTAFVIPVIGLICSAISISILQRLDIDGSDKDYVNERDRIYRHALAMRWLAIVILVLYAILIAICITSSIDAANHNAGSLRINSSFYE